MAVGESAVDNRLLLAALQKACAESGVELIARAVDDLAELDTDQIVLTAGIASPKLWPGLPVRPVKGEILRLRSRPGVTPRPAVPSVAASTAGPPTSSRAVTESSSAQHNTSPARIHRSRWPAYGT